MSIRIVPKSEYTTEASDQDRLTLQTWTEKWEKDWSSVLDWKTMDRWVQNDRFPHPDNPRVSTRAALRAMSRLGARAAGIA